MNKKLFIGIALWIVLGIVLALLTVTTVAGDSVKKEVFGGGRSGGGGFGGDWREPDQLLFDRFVSVSELEVSLNKK